MKFPSMWDFGKEFIVRSFTLHCKMLFLRLELVLTRSHSNNFTVTLRLPSNSSLASYVEMSIWYIETQNDTLK